MEEQKPIHISCEKELISENVIMPGDPLRAKYIAENFLEDSILVTSVRNMLGYTGFYKGKRITVMGHGMGMPSMSIYSYELFHFYDVKNIIRIGTCGAVSRECKLGDVVLADKSYTCSNFAYQFCGSKGNLIYPSEELNRKVLKAKEHVSLTTNFLVGGVMTMDVFGPYVNEDRILASVPKNINILAEEMECFGLLTVAKKMKRNATCLVTIVDLPFDLSQIISVEDREQALDNMITLALESIIED